MIERYKIDGGGSYFSSPKKDIAFIPTGCCPLDLALGGGWAENRIANIIGDKSSGKTLLAIEACANFARKYPKGRIAYCECEAAFDRDYAKALGMPVQRVEFVAEREGPIDTVEELFVNMSSYAQRTRQPVLYIVDSLDALSDRAEMNRDMEEGSYGASKAKQMSQLFRRLVRKLAEKHMTVIIISQVRSNIGVRFGSNLTRSGGRALDFYASQVVMLSKVGTIKSKKGGIERPIGLDIRAKVDKNKISIPLREAEFPIIFGYGVDDKQACLEWLKEHKCKVDGVDDLAALCKLVTSNWYRIENTFLPKSRKYA